MWAKINSFYNLMTQNQTNFLIICDIQNTLELHGEKLNEPLAAAIRQAQDENPGCTAIMLSTATASSVQKVPGNIRMLCEATGISHVYFNDAVAILNDKGEFDYEMLGYKDYLFKQDPQAYQKIARLYGLDTGQMMLIDDSVKHCQAAQDAGCQTIDPARLSVLRAEEFRNESNILRKSYDYDRRIVNYDDIIRHAKLATPAPDYEAFGKRVDALKAGLSI